MSNFSYDYGNAHWTVIDSDTYVDWTDSTLKAWVANDLANSKMQPGILLCFIIPDLVPL